MDSLQELNGHHGLIQAMWCVDSESGNECLVDVHKHTIIAWRVKGKLVDPEDIKGKSDGLV